MVNLLGGMKDSIDKLVAQGGRGPQPQESTSRDTRDEEGFADDEDEDGSPRTVDFRKNKLNDGPQFRDSETNQIHAAIRAHCRTLMKCGKKDPLPPPPSAQEIEWHSNRENGVGPSRDDFIINYLGSPGSYWNAAVTEIFVQDFLLSEWHIVTTDKQKITK
ncbi:hypothetical protein K439DRAFT_1625655, partial [Ramaria rubella]